LQSGDFLAQDRPLPAVQPGELLAVMSCGAYGYAVKPKISASLNAATRECYKYGGKECVIRTFFCDAKC